jgi:hypothetical protein
MPKCGIDNCTKYNHGGLGYFNHLRVNDFVVVETIDGEEYYCSPECADVR